MNQLIKAMESEMRWSRTGNRGHWDIADAMAVAERYLLMAFNLGLSSKK